MFANLNGIQIAYTDEGEGLPLLFIHGFPLNRRAWAHQVEAFKSRHRVIALDLRGFGESGSTSGPVSMSNFAEDVLALLDHLVTGPVILAGHSMGGYIALAFAKAYPQWLRGLALVGTKAGRDTSEIAKARRETAEKVRKEGAAVVVDAMAPKMLSPKNQEEGVAAKVRDLMAPASPQGIVGALLGMAERPDAGGWLGSIRVPTLVITGADDSIIPVSESEALVRSIPEAQLKVIPKAGHLVAVDQAEAFNEALKDWLAWGCNDQDRSQPKARPVEGGVRQNSFALHQPM